MKSASTPDVLISEVGPRDGLQSVARTMPTAAKFAWIDGLHAAGLREIEVCSFVPAAHLPQMADAAEVVRHALTLPGLTVMALVPNLRGAQAALAAGVHKLTLPVSASEAHSLANVRKTREEPTCIEFIAHRSRTDPNEFFLYEQYGSEQDWLDHQKTAHFAELVLKRAIPLLERRERHTFDLLY